MSVPGYVPQPPPRGRVPLWVPLTAAGVVLVLAAGITIWVTRDHDSLGARSPSASASASASPSPSPSPTADAPPGWTRMTSTDGEFSIAVPQLPTESTQQLDLEDYGSAETTLYVVPGDGDGQLSFNRTHVARAISPSDSDHLAQGFLDEFRAGVQDEVPDGTATMGTATPMTVGTFPGLSVEITVSTPSVSRVFEVAVTVLDHDVFQFAAYGDQRENFEIMLDSFRFAGAGATGGGPDAAVRGAP